MLSWLTYNALCALPLALCVLLFAKRLPHRPALVHLGWLLVLTRLVWPSFESGTNAAPQVAVFSSQRSWQVDLVAWTSRHFGSNWSFWLVVGITAIWIAGALFVLAREARALLALQRLLRRARPATQEQSSQVERIANDLELSVPRLLTLEGLSGPFVCSPLRPTLVLPADGPSHPSVLAHELAHLARRDPWTALFEVLVASLHWWNPLARHARRGLRHAAETSCDAHATEHFPQERRTFAAALLRAIETPAMDGSALHAGGWSAAELEERLRRILAGRDRSRPSALGAAVLALCFLASLPGAAAPSLATFRAALPTIPTGLDHTAWSEREAGIRKRLANDPRDAEAWHLFALAHLAAGRPDEAADAFGRLEALGPDAGPLGLGGRAAYNKSCALTLAGRLDEAFAALERGLRQGMPPEGARRDPDLRSLRADERFEALLLRIP